jgi:hypothetical protein
MLKIIILGLALNNAGLGMVEKLPFIMSDYENGTVFDKRKEEKGDLRKNF